MCTHAASRYKWHSEVGHLIRNVMISFMTMSLRTFNPMAMAINADTASERTYLPMAFRMKNTLLLADAGYTDFEYFANVERHQGFDIFRGKQSLNPRIVEARNGKGPLLPKLAGMKLKDITRRTNRSEVLDLRVRRGTQEFRVIKRWFAEEKR